MSRAQELLDAATPLPWDRQMFAANAGREIGWDADAALIVYAVNALPAYEAAREALDIFLHLFSRSVVDESAEGLWDAADAARAALTRLRDEVPA